MYVHNNHMILSLVSHMEHATDIFPPHKNTHVPILHVSSVLWGMLHLWFNYKLPPSRTSSHMFSKTPRVCRIHLVNTTSHGTNYHSKEILAKLPIGMRDFKDDAHSLKRTFVLAEFTFVSRSYNSSVPRTKVRSRPAPQRGNKFEIDRMVLCQDKQQLQ